MTTTAEIVNFSKEIREGRSQICPLTAHQMKKNAFLTYITFNIQALERALFELEENANYITLRFGRKQMCRINTLASLLSNFSSLCSLVSKLVIGMFGTRPSA